MNEQMQLSNIRLFVSTKFSDLKYTIDIEYSKKITSTVDEKQRKSLIQIWAGLIDKIESIESKCVQNLRSIFKLFKKELPDQMGQFELESQLFMNTTILYISEEDLVQLNLIEKMSRLSGKLIIIKNCYFRPENLLKEPNEPISREYVICKQIEKIFENLTLINPIHEIELSIDCLTKLDLSNGNIKSIDSNTFKNLFNLTKIDLAHNQLTSLDSNLLTTQHNLIYIGLNNNKITKLNSDLFRNSTKLKYIYLNYNNLAELDAKQFSGLKELTHLYLNNNVLKCLHKNTLNSLSSLEFIELSNNLIGDLDEALFFGLTRLKTINLCNNLLTAIHSNLFNDLAELKSLFISSNQLTKFNANTFKGLENLDKLFLGKC